jgi:hypothetical protein
MARISQNGLKKILEKFQPKLARKTKTIKKLTKTALNVGRETVCTANVSPKKSYCYTR